MPTTGRAQGRLAETEGAIQTLLDMVEKGHMDRDDPALAERMRKHKANRARLNDEIALAGGTVTVALLTVTPKSWSPCPL